ncbi:MAG: phosphatidylserine/phosphatidylglycerophosphate/cardiolipin synthase family protein [Chlamydiales bacterium]|nr:phosphatidylserine/phosphatidylglycerophosphate/cardiolipin synthase family protein [Chlamydiales bacterium]
MAVIAAPTITFVPPQHGIGEHKIGHHWVDLPGVEKAWHTAKALFKILATAALAGTATFYAVPIAGVATTVAFTTAGLTAALGLALLAYTFYRIYHVDQNAPIPFLDGTTPLGAWADNSVFITESSTETMEMKSRLIASAQHSIEISGSYCGGAIFDRMLIQIQEKLEQNPALQVKIIANDDLLTPSNYEKIRDLAARYPNNFFLLETKQQYLLLPSLRTISNHTKMVIVDGVRCITGGTGIQDVLSREGGDNVGQGASLPERVLGRGARDMDALVTGPAAETLRHEYYQLLAKWQSLTPERRQYGNLAAQRGYERIPANVKQASLEQHDEIFQDKARDRIVTSPTAVITGSYEHGDAHGCRMAYQQMIRSAKKSIAIAHMCLNQPEVIRELEGAAARGIEITIITNGSATHSPLSSRFLAPANRSALERLMRFGNVKCYEYTQESTLYHKKVMVIDEQLTTMGSYNISFCAETEDEDMVVFDSAEVAEQTLRVLQEDALRSRRVGPSTTFYYYLNEFLKMLTLQASAHISQ